MSVRLVCTIIGVLGFTFGISERILASTSDGYVSAEDLTLLFTSLFFFVVFLLK